jgi:starch synthase
MIPRGDVCAKGGNQTMKILFTASECVPFVKTGGLADVVGSLAPVLAAQGHDVRVILPKYGSIPEEYERRMFHTVDFEVNLGWRRQYCGIEQLDMNGVTYYFLDNRYYFGRNYVYGMGGDEYERFAFFCRGVLNALPLIPFIPDVIHAHDWQTGMIPALLRIQYQGLPKYDPIRTVFTIHNLRYQGVFGIRDVQDVLGLPDSVFTDDKLEYFGNANYLKAGIVYADEVTTVSPSYAEEIQTAYYGENLDGLLRARNNHLTGILNGIDVKEYNPATNENLASKYDANDLSGKAACKRALQEELGLVQRPDVPIIAMITRLSNQKGLDLVDYVIADIMHEDVQFVCLGMGEARYVNLFSWAEQNYPGRVAARFVMDAALAHRIYAGADIFLMPSGFEPCGLSQMLAMRYGTIPVVRETGGLKDTVLSYNEFTDEGNGFTFLNYNAHDMLHVIRRALHYYWNQKDVWQKLQHRGMTADFSWETSSGHYTDIYHSLAVPSPVKQGALKAREEEAKAAPAKPAAKKSVTEAAEKAEEKPAKKPAVKKATAKTTAKVAAEKPAPKAAVKKPAAKVSAKTAKAKKETEPKAE